MLEAAGRFGPGAKKPYQHELREKLLHEEVEDTKKMIKDHAQEWKKTGCSLMTDAWTDQKRRSIMNICINSAIGTYFVESKEVSAESIFDNEDVVDGFYAAIETFYHGDFQKQNEVINNDFHKFKDKLGHFGKKVALFGCKDPEFNPGILLFVFESDLVVGCCINYMIKKS